MSRYLKLLVLWLVLPWFFLGVIVAGFAAWMREIRQVWWNVPYHWRMARELSREILNPGCTAREYADRKMPNKQPAALAEQGGT